MKHELDSQQGFQKATDFALHFLNGRGLEMVELFARTRQSFVSASMSFYMRPISLQVAVGVSWQAGFDKSLHSRLSLHFLSQLSFRNQSYQVTMSGDQQPSPEVQFLCVNQILKTTEDTQTVICPCLINVSTILKQPKGELAGNKPQPLTKHLLNQLQNWGVTITGVQEASVQGKKKEVFFFLVQEVGQYLHAVQRTLVSTEEHKGNTEVNMLKKQLLWQRQHY